VCGSGRDGHRPQTLEVVSLLKLAPGNVLFPSTALPEQSAMEINSGKSVVHKGELLFRELRNPFTMMAACELEPSIPQQPSVSDDSSRP
jgi:hypothetical protein